MNPGWHFLQLRWPVARSVAFRKAIPRWIGFSLTLLIGAPGLRAQQPTGGTVVSGTATITAAPGSTTITAGNNSVLRWNSFDVGTGQTVQFVQPGAEARVLNWIGNQTPSQINGTLLANGQVYLINPAGVYFGGTAVVNVGQLYAIGGSLSREDFLAGLNRFTSLTGAVRNDGTIRGSAVALVGRTVINTGTILSTDGFIALGAGDEVLLGRNGSGIYVDAGPAAAPGAPVATGTPGVANTGTIDAGQGSVILAAGDLYSLAITQDGKLSARDVQLQGQGRGDVLVSGTINATATKPGETGGAVTITGERVGLLTGASIDASGPAGGGTILVGGDLHGANSNVRNATATSVRRGATITADATDSGNGGKVVIWSDGDTRFSGFISARGAGAAGAGGFAEVSGKNFLSFQGLADLSAHSGLTGTLLLDPTDITITGAGTDTDPTNGSFTGGIFDGGASATSTIYIGTGAGDTNSTLLKQLSLANVDITTTSVGAGTGNINVTDAINYTSTNSLSLLAGNDLTIASTIKNLGSGALTVQATTGTVTLSAPVVLTGGNFVSGGNNFTNSGTGSISTNGGTINLLQIGTVSLGAQLSASDITVTAAGGITLAAPITTTGGQTYNDAVTLGAGVTLSGTTLTLGSTLAGGGNDLTLAFSTGNGVNGAEITGVKNLATNAGPTTLTGTITTSGTQSYNTAVTLGGDATLGSSGIGAAGDITFGSTVGGAHNLTVNTAGTTAFNGAVSGIASVTTDAPGGTTVAADVTTTGAQAYHDGTTLGGNATLTGTTLSLGSTLAGGGNDLTLAFSTGNGVNGAVITGVKNLATNAGPTTLTGTITTSGTQSYNTAVTLGGDAILGSSGAGASGDITFGSTVGGTHNLTVSTAGTTAFNGAVGGITSVTTDAPGGTTVAADITTTGTQAYNDAVTLGAGVTLSGTTLGLGSTLAGGGNDLTLAFSAGNGVNGAVVTGVRNLATNGGLTTLTGAITTSGTQSYTTGVTLGGNTTLSGTTLSVGSTLAGGGNDLTLAFSTGNGVNGAVITGVKNLATNAGPTTLTGTITTSGTQSYNTAVTLGGDATVGSSGIGAAGDITFGTTVGGAHNLTVNTAGTTAFNGAVSGITSVTTDAPGSTTVAADVTTTGAQAYHDGVTLSGNATLGGTTLNLGSTLAGGGNDLTLAFSTGNGVNGAVITGVKNLATNGGQTTLTGAITTSGTQSYNTGVTLGGNTTLSGTTLTLGGTLTGAGNDLTLAFSTDDVVDGAVIIGVKNLTTNGGSTTLTGAITTSGTQNYNTVVTLGGDAVLVSSGAGVAGNITFNSTLGGAYNLTVNTAGTTAFNGAVSGITSVTTDAPGSTTLAASIATTGGQTYHDAVTLGGNTTLSGTTLGLGSTLAGGGNDLTLAFSAGNTLTGITGVRNLATNAGPTTLTGTITTTGTQSYSTAVTLSGDTTLVSSGVGAAGNITVGSTVGGAHNLTVNTAGTTAFNGPVSGITSVTTDAPGGTTLAADITTTGTQTYHDAVTLGAGVTLSGTTLSVGSTLAGGGNDLTLAFSTGNGVNGAVITGVKNLATNAGPTTLTGTITTSGTQSYNTAVTLGGDATVGSSGIGAAGDITFGTTVGGAHNLTVNTAGTTAFNGAVSGITSVTTDAPGGTTVAADVTTTGAQAYHDGVTLSGNTTLTGTTLNLGSTLAGGGNDLTLAFSTGNGVNGAVITGVKNLATNAGPTTLTGTITTSGTQSYNTGVTLGGNTTLSGTTLTLGGTLTGAGNDLTLAFSTDDVVDGAVIIGVKNLTTNGGSTTLTGAITTSGTQSYNTAVTLGGNSALTGTTLSLGSTLAGAGKDLTLAFSTGNVLTSAGIAGVRNLATSGGPTILSGTITTSGTQSYNTAVTLGGDAILGSSGAGDITFGSSVGGAHNLTVNTAGTTAFNGAVGGIMSVTTDAPGGTTVAADITTTGAQTYHDAVTLGTDVTLGSSGAGDITFGSTVGGTHNLTVSTAGTTAFNGAVGGITSVTTDAPGGTTVAADITTTGTQAYNDAVTLGAGVTLSGTTLGLGSTLAGGGNDLTLAFSAGNGVNGAVVTGVRNLATNGGLTTLTGAITTSGTQSYTTGVTLGGNTTLSGTTLSVGSTLAGGGNDLTLAFSTGNGVNGAVITGVKNLATNAGPTTLTGTITTSGTQSYNTAVTLGGDATVGSSGIGAAGDITFGTTVGGAHNLTVNTAGTTAFNGAVSGITSVTTDAPGSTTVAADVTTTGAQAYHDGVTLSGNATLGGTTLNLGSTLAGGGNDLTLAFSTGNGVNGAVITGVKNLATNGGQTTLTGAITTSGTQSYNTGVTLGGNTTLSGTTLTLGGTLTGAGNDLTLAFSTDDVVDGAVIIGVKNLTTNGGSTTLTGAITTSGTQNYNTVVTLGGDAVLVSSGAGVAGNITFNSTLGGAYNLTVNTAGTTAFNGAVSGITSVTTDAPGSTTLAASIATTGGQTYHDAVTLGADVTSGSSGAGNITFGSSVGGAHNLTVNTAGTTAFNGAVGGIMSVTTDAPGGTTVGADITTTGAQTYHDAVTLGTDVTLGSSGAGDITFGSTVGGTHNLTVNTAGTTAFNGAVGGITSVTTDAPGGTTLAASIATTGGQTYHDAVTLGADVTLGSSGAGNITFDSTMSGAHNLTVNTTGATAFNGAVGGITSVTTDAPGSTTLTADITTTGTQTYHDAVTLGADVTLGSSGAGDITFGSTVGGAYNLTVNTAGTTAFNGPVSGITSVTTDAPGSTNLAASIATTGGQTFNDAVTLGAGVTLSGTTLGLGSTLDGNGNDLTLGFSLGNYLTGTGISNVGNLTTDGGPTFLAGLITTNGSQNYHTAVKLLGNTTLSGTTLGLGSTLDGNGNDLTLGFSLGNYLTGTGISNVGNLTTDGGPTFLAGLITTNGSQNYNTAVKLLGSTTLSGTTLGLGSTLDGNGNDLTLGFSLGNYLTGTGISNVGNLTTDVGPTFLAGLITTNGSQNYHTAVKLLGNTTLSGTTLGLGSTLDGNGNDLTLGFSLGNYLTGTGISNVGNLTTDVGPTFLAGLIATAGSQTYNTAVTLTGNTSLTGTVLTLGSTLGGNGNDLTLGFSLGNHLTGTGINNVGNLTTNGGPTFLAGLITTNGSQDYNTAVTLSGDTTLTGTTLILGSTLAGGGKDLTLAFSSGGTLNGALFAGVNNLTTNVGPITLLGAITTTGNQTYNTAVTLGGDTTLTGAAVKFKTTIGASTDGGQSLLVDVSGDATFGGMVGLAGARLSNFTTTAGGRTRLNGGGVSTTGAQAYDNAVVLGADVALSSAGAGSAGNIVFNRTLDGSYALTVNTAGTTSFGGFVGSTAGLAAVTTDAAGTTIFNVAGSSAAQPAVRTMGAQTYNDPLALGSDTTLNSTAGSITLQQTVSGPGKALALIAPQGTITVAQDLGSESGRLSTVSANGRDVVIGQDIWAEGEIALGIGNDGNQTENDFLRFNLDGAAGRNTRIDSLSGEIILGGGAAGSPVKTEAPLRSSLYKSNDGDLYLFAHKVTVQPFERLAVRNGSLVAIADGTATDDGITLSNTAVANYLVLVSSNPGAPGISLRSRGPADIHETQGNSVIKDLGTDLIAGAVLFFDARFGVVPTRTQFAPTPTPSTDPTFFDYATRTGNILANGGTLSIAILPDAAGAVHNVFVADLLVTNQFRPLRPNLAYLDLSTEGGFGAFRDGFIGSPTFGVTSDTPMRTLVATGAQIRDTPEQIFAPDVPRKDRDAAPPEADLTSGVREQLQALGIYARALRMPERVSRDHGAGLFVTVPESEHPQVSDYEVADARVEDRAVREVIRLATEAGLLAQGQARLNDVEQALATSFDAFSVTSASGGAHEYRMWLEARHDADAKRVLQFLGLLRSVLTRIELLGLTHQELEGSKAQIYGSILRSRLNVDPEFLRELVQDLQSGRAIISVAPTVSPAATSS